MSNTEVHAEENTTEHSITVTAPPQAVYELVADVGQWPQIFPPTIHAESVESDGREERIRIWATANDEVKGWESRRVLDHEGLRVGFRQQVSRPPVAAMSGKWSITPAADGGSLITLTHTFRSVDGTPEQDDWIRRAIKTNSGAELAALLDAAEQCTHREELEMSFQDTLEIHGAAGDVYDYIRDAHLWKERLPHVAKVDIDESLPGVQTLEMDTVAPDGNQHTTRSIRICESDGTIAYKQLLTPALLAVHTGLWSVREQSATTVLSSAHTVVIEPDAVTTVLGADATIADARAFIREALGRNSMATMRHAKEHVEGRGPA